MVLARRPIRRKARASMLAWLLYLPAYGLMALATACRSSSLGAFVAAFGQSSAVVLAQLGRAGGACPTACSAASSG